MFTLLGQAENFDSLPVRGKDKYVIPTSRKVKKALTAEQLQTLLEARDGTTRGQNTAEQQKALDLFWMSYSLGGCNLKDLAQLRYSNIDGDSITFRRAKTINSSPKPIHAP